MNVGDLYLIKEDWLFYTSEEELGNSLNILMYNMYVVKKHSYLVLLEIEKTKTLKYRAKFMQTNGNVGWVVLSNNDQYYFQKVS